MKQKKEKKIKNKILYFTIFVSFCIFLLIGAGTILYDFDPNPEIRKIGNSTLLVCLAGGKGRISSAINLYLTGKGSALFIAGAGPKSSKESILREYATAFPNNELSENRRDSIIVETQSRNTIENAYAVARFLRSNPEVTDIILITSSYHMKRSVLILENAFRNNITIHPYVAKESTFSRENWYLSPIGVGITLLEFGKFILAKTFLPVLEIF